DALDPQVAGRLSADLAARFGVVPLCIIGGTHLAVACIEPLGPEALAALEIAYNLPVMQGIAAELRVLYHLERAYGIERENPYRRPRRRQTSTPPDGGAERRCYASEISDAPEDHTGSGETALGKISVKKMAIKLIGEVDPGLEVDTPEKAVRSMRRVNDR